MMNCIYCNAEIPDKTSTPCPNCKAKNPMSKRPAEMTPEYKIKLRRLEQEKMPDKLVAEGTIIQTSPAIGAMIGLFSAIVIGLFCYYIFAHLALGKSSPTTETPEEITLPEKKE